MTPSLDEPPTPQRFLRCWASSRISLSLSGRLKTVVAVLPLRPAVSRRTLTGPEVCRVTVFGSRALRRSPSLLDHTMLVSRLAMALTLVDHRGAELAQRAVQRGLQRPQRLFGLGDQEAALDGGEDRGGQPLRIGVVAQPAGGGHGVQAGL